MPRFLVKRHRQIKEKESPAGAPVRCSTTRAAGHEAVVKADTEARRIYLRVNGPGRKEYLGSRLPYGRSTPALKNSTSAGASPCRMSRILTADYQTLLDHLKAGMDKYMPEGTEKHMRSKSCWAW